VGILKPYGLDSWFALKNKGPKEVLKIPGPASDPPAWTPTWGAGSYLGPAWARGEGGTGAVNWCPILSLFFGFSFCPSPGVLPLVCLPLRVCSNFGVFSCMFLDLEKEIKLQLWGKVTVWSPCSSTSERVMMFSLRERTEGLRMPDIDGVQSH
jgi:hypothetical protein